MATYSIRQNIGYLLNDSPEHLDFHVKTGDYFAFVATLMGFVEESLARCDSTNVPHNEREMARELRNDLQYVHSNYKIVPRDPDEIEPVRPSGNILPK